MRLAALGLGLWLIATQAVAQASEANVRIKTDHGVFIANSADNQQPLLNKAVDLVISADHINLHIDKISGNDNNQLACRLISEQFIGSMLTPAELRF